MFELEPFGIPGLAEPESPVFHIEKSKGRLIMSAQELKAEDIQAMREKLMGMMGDEASAYPSNIEKGYPRILARLIEVWNTPELPRYLDELTFSTRAGRMGFPSSVAMELFNLGNLDAVQRQLPESDGTGFSTGVTI